MKAKKSKSKKRVKGFMTGDAVLRKYIAGLPLYIKEENILEDYLIKKADGICSRYVKQRDGAKKKNILCITHKADGCMIMIDTTNNDQCNNCHWISRERYNYRRALRNCNSGCVSCNAFHKEAHKQEYDMVMGNKYGNERTYNKRVNKNKIIPNTQELLEIISCFEALLEGTLQETAIENKRLLG